MRNTGLVLSVLGALGLASLALAQTPPPQAPAASAPPDPEVLKIGETAFKARCRDCHDPAVGEAPAKAEIAKIKPDDIYAILKTGLMQPMADGLKDDEMRAIVVWLTAPAGKDAK